MDSLGQDILSIIVSNLDIIDIMVFRGTSKSIRDNIHVNIIKTDNKLTNEYNNTKITKIIEYYCKVFHIRTLNGKLQGNSKYYTINSYYMIYMDDNIEFNIIQNYATGSLIIIKHYIYYIEAFVYNIRQSYKSLYYDDIKKLNYDIINKKYDNNHKMYNDYMEERVRKIHKQHMQRLLDKI